MYRSILFLNLMQQFHFFEGCRVQNRGFITHHNDTLLYVITSRETYEWVGAWTEEALSHNDSALARGVLPF